MPTYYTVDRRGTFEEGIVAELKYWDNIAPDYLGQHNKELFPDGLSYHGFNFLLSPDSTLLEGDSVMELLIENIRRAHYPEKLSRFQALFAFESLEDAKKFKEEFGQPYNKIYTIDYDGEVHRGNIRNFISNFSILMSSYLYHNYWNNKEPFRDNGESWEILLPLPQTIGKVVDG